ncbi:hypothetical protein Nepgr_012171 [Nepenthes gracilis]|uniref:Uncharacterized protein n=1 Tax=Nepenthes gracilis TaxID=150966 RepID=A0AAD3SGG9_NEPGR|nr:hypothetical protein Nepgr_012171 [Nepenthes gracilis]
MGGSFPRFPVLLLILLLLSQSRSSSSRAEGSAEFVSEPCSEMSNGDFNGGLRGDRGEEVDCRFDGEKRKIYIGPNPLHNR